MPAGPVTTAWRGGAQGLPEHFCVCTLFIERINCFDYSGYAQIERGWGWFGYMNNVQLCLPSFKGISHKVLNCGYAL